MGRTANPNDYLNDFQSAVKDSIARHRRVELALHAAGEPDTVRKSVAEDTAFRLGVLWETFQGAWYLAAISRNQSVFRGYVQGELNSKVQDPWARTALEAIRADALKVPANLKMPQIVKILDPQGFNITFADAKSWNKSAAKHLGPVHAARVNSIASNNEAESLVHLVKKLRNHLAHSSDGSADEFNTAAKARGTGRRGLVGAANDPLRRDTNRVKDVGRYLRAKTGAGGPQRLEVLYERMVDVSEMLRT